MHEHGNQVFEQESGDAERMVVLSADNDRAESRRVVSVEFLSG
jgi:hypothetical protein